MARHSGILTYDRHPSSTTPRDPSGNSEGGSSTSQSSEFKGTRKRKNGQELKPFNAPYRLRRSKDPAQTLHSIHFEIASLREFEAPTNPSASKTERKGEKDGAVDVLGLNCIRDASYLDLLDRAMACSDIKVLKGTEKKDKLVELFRGLRPEKTVRLDIDNLREIRHKRKAGKYCQDVMGLYIWAEIEKNSTRKRDQSPRTHCKMIAAIAMNRHYLQLLHELLRAEEVDRMEVARKLLEEELAEYREVFGKDITEDVWSFGERWKLKVKNSLSSSRALLRRTCPTGLTSCLADPTRYSRGAEDTTWRSS